ncbi:Uncharacterised protein [Mycobacteroides abscessus subsp. abscessus]|nr:Uncharacterised protein [Mycobacteroides abscessus subsp. abscessus]
MTVLMVLDWYPITTVTSWDEPEPESSEQPVARAMSMEARRAVLFMEVLTYRSR